MQLTPILRSILIWGIYIIPFIPLIVSTSMFFPFITGKNFFFRFLVEILLGVWIILAFRDSSFRPKFSWLLAALTSFIGIMAIANIFGENITKSFWSNYERMDGYVTLLHLFAYFLIATSVMKTEALWRRFFHVSMGVSLFIALYGFLQITGALNINQGGVRVDGTLGNATYLAAYMFIHLFLTAFWGLREIRSIEKSGAVMVSGFVGFGLFVLWGFVRAGSPHIDLGSYEKLMLAFSVLALGVITFLYIRFRTYIAPSAVLYLLLLASQASILYYTGTRGAILGLFGGTFLIVFLLIFLNRGAKKIRKWFLISGIILILLFGGLFALRDIEAVKTHPAVGRLVNISYDDAESRFLIWNMSLKGWKEHPILGWGQGNFSLVFNKYYDPKMFKQEPWFDRAHNIVFDWLVAGGLLGFLSYLSIFVASLYYLLYVPWKGGNDPPLVSNEKNKKSDRKNDKSPSHNLIFSPLSGILLTGFLAAYFFQNLFVFDQLISYIFFFSVLAMIHTEAISRSYLSNNTANKEKAVTKKQADGTAWHVIISIVIIATPLLVYAINADGYRANKNLLFALSPQEGGGEQNLEFYKKALSYESFGTTEIREQLAQFAINMRDAEIPQDKRDELVSLALNEMRAQVEEVPGDARYKLFLSTLLLSYGLNDEALIVLEDALEVSPKKQNIYYSLANAHLAKDEIDKAFAYTKTAFELDMENDEARRFYAAVAIYAGEDNLSEELLKLYGENLPYENVFVNAYVSRGQFDKALEMQQIRAKSFPNDYNAYVGIAAASMELGMREEAITALKKAIDLNEGFRAQGEEWIRIIEAGGKP